MLQFLHLAIRKHDIMSVQSCRWVACIKKYLLLRCETISSNANRRSLSSHLAHDLYTILEPFLTNKVVERDCSDPCRFSSQEEQTVLPRNAEILCVLANQIIIEQTI